MRWEENIKQKETRTFEEIEKQELAEQETKQLNEEIEDPEFRSFFKMSWKNFHKNVYGYNECFRNF